MINGHGDDIHSCNTKIVSNFSSNIYIEEDNYELRPFLCSQLNTIDSYPEPDAGSLAHLIAEKSKVADECICVTNGATEAIYLIAQVFKRKETAIVIPTFSEYEDACRIHEHKLYFYSHPNELQSDIDLVWICNPNNPTGFIYDKKELLDLVKQFPKTCFVFDQSYEAYTNQDLLSIEEAAQFPNILLLHSMTKQFSIPGLRLGYISGHPNLTERIQAVRMPWAVNQLAIEAGKYLVNKASSASTFSTRNKHLLEETDFLKLELSNIPGIQVFSSQMLFFLCKLENRKAADLKCFLIENYGILIRDAANFRGLDETYFRVATQSHKENVLLLKGIKEWISR